jgi:hypothetical protein
VATFPAKKTKLGFALIDAKGDDVTLAANFDIYPLPEAESLSEDLGYTFLEWADGRKYLDSYVAGLKSIGGSLTLPMIPGYCADLFAWATTRDSDEQGKWAVINAEYVHTRRKFRDCKCATARLSFRGAELAMMRFDVTGRFAGTGVDLTSTDALEVAPYKIGEQKFEIKLGGTGSYSTTTYMSSLDIEIDNSVESPEDGATIEEQYYSYDLGNDYGPRVTGTLDRRFIDDDLYADFIAGTEGKLRITLTRAAVATAIITLPRIIYTGQGLHAGGSGLMRETGVPFTALGSGTHYATAPITLAEA